jgi:hypothetical protein
VVLAVALAVVNVRQRVRVHLPGNPVGSCLGAQHSRGIRKRAR